MSSTLTNEIEYLENSMLSKKDLEDYDLERTYYMVIKFLKNYKRLKCKSFNAPQIKVTTKYKYIFVDEPTRNPNEYTKFDEYLDNKTEYMILSEKITLVTELMTEEEVIYFTNCLYKGNKEYQAYQEIGCSKKGLIPIKSSCIVKFACAFNSEVYMPRLVNNNNRSIENLEYDIDVKRLAYINDSNNMVYYKLPDLELSKDFELADTTHLHFKYKKNRINAFCTTDVLFNKIDTTISYMSLNTSLGITHDGIKYKRNIPYSMYYFKKDGLTIKNILDAAFDSIYKDYKYYGIAPDYILLSFNHESVGFRNFEYFNRSKYHFDSIDDMDDLNIKKMRQSNRSFSLSVYIYFTISFVLVLFFELMLLIRVIKRTKKQIIPYYKEHRRLPRGYELDPPQLYFWSTYISLIIAIIVLFFLYISAIQYLRYI